MEQIKDTSKNKALRKICHEMLRIYGLQMHDYLSEEKITQSDVIVMILNVVSNVSKNIYFSLKEYLPGVPMDFDFMRAKIINEISKDFNEIKDYTPNTELLRLTNEQVKEILDKGFTVIKMENGEEIRATAEDLLFKKDEIEKYEKEKNKECSDATNSPQDISKGTLIL